MDNARGHFSLSANALKIIALVSMTLDHMGLILFPQVEGLRIAGRLAFPIFAFMIAEGCRLTRSKWRYFLMVFALGVVCQAVQLFVDGSLHMNILLTFSASIVCIYAVQYCECTQSPFALAVPIAVLSAAAFVCGVLPQLVRGSGFAFDYGFVGVLLPVFISIPKKTHWRLVAAAVGLALVCVRYGGIQWWSMLALGLLALYNGERGRLKMKYLFYIYYPLHFAVLWGISELI